MSDSTAADISDVERAVLALQQSHLGMVSLEALGRLLIQAEAMVLAGADRPITVDDVCALHVRLMEGTRDAR